VKGYGIHIREWPTTLTLSETSMGVTSDFAVVELNRDEEGVTVTVRTSDDHSYPESATIRSVY
jgi:hypothetical protein